MLTNIYLIGMPGSGKSVTGHLLATDLGLHFVDTDALIVKKEGREIKDIFKDPGEEYFRDDPVGLFRRCL